MDRWELAVPNGEDAKRGLVLLVVGAALLGLHIYDAVTYYNAVTWQLVLAVLSVVSGWRIRTMGLYVSRRGVRIKLPYQTRTFDWFEVRDFESRPQPGSKRLIIWVVPKMDEAQRTSVRATPEVLEQLRARIPARSVEE